MERMTLVLLAPAPPVKLQEHTAILFHGQVATPPSTLRRPRKQTQVRGNEGDESISLSESEDGGKEVESCTSANQINEEMQRMLNQL